MSTKLFIVFAALCAVLLATQTASCKEVDGQQFDEPIPDLEEVTGTVTHPLGSNGALLSPLVGIDDYSVVACNSGQCQQLCRALGYRQGRCDNQARCICT